MSALFTLQTEGIPLPAIALTAFWRAADLWSEVLGPENHEVHLDGVITGVALPNNVVGWGNSVVTVSIGDHLLEQGPVTELRTGIDPNGSTPDWRITVDPVKTAGYGPTEWYEFFLHELGHSLSWNGLGPNSPDKTLWDALVRETQGGPVFIGELAMAVNHGYPVGLSPDMLHYSGIGLMSAIPQAQMPPVTIGPMELAMLGDTHVPLAAMVHGAIPQEPMMAPVASSHPDIWMA